VKLRWLTSGSETLRRHIAFIAADNPAAAVKVRRRIRTTVLRLCQFPESGRTGHVSGTRELVVSGLPYIVVYRLRENTVEILRVVHTSMNQPAGRIQ
jgi:plasmid stabilization system protein ParE